MHLHCIGTLSMWITYQGPIAYNFYLRKTRVILTRVFSYGKVNGKIMFFLRLKFYAIAPGKAKSLPYGEHVFSKTACM